MNMKFLIFLFLLAIPAHASQIPRSWNRYLAQADKAGAEQLMLVLATTRGKSRAILHCLEKHNDGWRFALRPMSASVGRNGIADPGLKREGDGMSPWGLYPLGMAFGYAATFPTKMPYRQMYADDVWVDDPTAPDYNRLVKKSATAAASFEYMRRRDELYRAGLVVEYNTEPVIGGLGSAIFIHFWGRSFNSTAGCLGLPRRHLEAVLGFLDPNRRPMIAFYRQDNQDL